MGDSKEVKNQLEYKQPCNKLFLCSWSEPLQVFVHLDGSLHIILHVKIKMQSQILAYTIIDKVIKITQSVSEKVGCIANNP
jgi:hypothetical protein